MAGNSASLRDSHALRLVSELPDLRAANVHRRICSRKCPLKTKGHPSQRKKDADWRPLRWLGWPDLNRRVRESKSRALPLGDIPLNLQQVVLYHTCSRLSSIYPYVRLNNFIPIGYVADGESFTYLISSFPL